MSNIIQTRLRDRLMLTNTERFPVISPRLKESARMSRAPHHGALTFWPPQWTPLVELYHELHRLLRKQPKAKRTRRPHKMEPPG